MLAMQRKFMRGMGHKMNEKPSEEMSKRARALIRLRCCAISNEALTEPVVACELGNLFNKEAVIRSLLERTLNQAFEHIRGMKDLIECKFTVDPDHKDLQLLEGASETKGADLDEEEVGGCRYICPVTRVEMNAKYPFVVIRPTGWVLSDKAVREIGIEQLQEEYGPFTAEDVIRLAPEEEEEGVLRERMLARRAAAKKEKKRKRAEAGEGGEAPRREKKEKEARPKALPAPPKVAAGDLKVASVVAEAMKAAEKEMASSSSFASLFNDGKGGKADASKMFIQTGAARWSTK